MTEPYKPGTCWHGIKVSQRDIVPCGLKALEYSVGRFLSIHGAKDGPPCRVWLCLNHKESMERDGFILSLTSPSKEA